MGHLVPEETDEWTTLRCPECWGQQGRPYRATSLYRQLRIISVRCPECQHRWTMTRDETGRPIPVLRLRRDRRTNV
jgi:hypothetical protein